MKTIKISKSHALYRFFERLQQSDYYSFIRREYDDEGNHTLNSFNDVCTFVKHCGLIALNSLFYVFVASLVLIVLVSMVGVIFGTMFVSASDIFKGEYSMFSSALIMFPVIFYLNYRYNLSQQHPVDGDNVKETVVSKFVEIVSAKSSKYCVKIDVVEDEEPTGTAKTE